ncbi:hypothetical protein QBC45DRAFT_96239 [Copromyces sp. CBS 386.78]|nr:hypothetical protein QBC45DRAFT_96239 [Copromyces sp. CBS 386.78]
MFPKNGKWLSGCCLVVMKVVEESCLFADLRSKDVLIDAVDADDDRKERVSQTSWDTILLYQLSFSCLHPFDNTKIPYIAISPELPNSYKPKETGPVPTRRYQNSNPLDDSRSTTPKPHHAGSWWSHPPSRISPLTPPSIRVLFSDPPQPLFSISPDGRSEQAKSYHQTFQNTRCQAPPFPPGVPGCSALRVDGMNESDEM